MQVIEFLEEEINNSLKEIKERKTQAAINKTQIKEITQDLKIEKESIKKTLIKEVLLKSQKFKQELEMESSTTEKNRSKIESEALKILQKKWIV